MLESFLAHLNALTVDLIFTALAAVVFLIWRTRASILVLVNYSLIIFLVYGVLAYLRYSSAYIVDYHLLMAAYMAAFSILIQASVKKHGLLKLALWANVLLHGIMVTKEPAYQLDKITYDTYTVIYNSYSPTRIMIVSLQILGLIDGGIYGGRNDTYHRIRSHLRRYIHDFRVHTISLLRVKRP